ncbi:bacteriocin immunity protein [Lactiplantibacillus garii]|uniref:Bacteriocin immunity protein n=1 Tax=Lactiplantibacillus garii TaxID=2306423 RepID=A0A3R8L008_9LACO|nr:bacteriocin immunity protein [Lactiplantibacillus garii]RRK09800.1 bacteriocin immunity protein [Lactiplantibacillus garii]
MSDEKLNAMINQLSQLYQDGDVQKNPELRAMIQNAANRLNNDEDFGKVVSDLSHAISQRYVAHHDVPKAMIVFYNQIQKDVQAGKYDDTNIRNYFIATGLISLSISFGGF